MATGGEHKQEASDGGASVNEMINALTNALKGISSHKSPPPVKLSKFKGLPKSPGDISLKDWLEEFEVYCDYYSLSDSERYDALINHLGGTAKDEVHCRMIISKEHKNVAQAIKILELAFKPADSVSGYSSTFYSRQQLEGETIADYSLALIKLYSQLVEASSDSEQAALKHLQDTTLKQRLVEGIRDPSVKRELKRIELAYRDRSFFEMREEVLELFKDEKIKLKPRVHGVGCDEPSYGFSEIKKELQSLKKQLDEVQRRTFRKPRSNYPTVRCYNCGKNGHIKGQCEVEVRYIITV